MGLNYDFDIFRLDTPVADPDRGGFLARLGLMPRKRSARPDMTATGPTRIALFREARTAEALRGAHDGLRAYFLSAGFGLNTYASGAPRHRYPAGDERARLDIIDRLTATARSHALPAPEDYPEGHDVFRLGEFLADLASACPTDVGRDRSGLGADTGSASACLVDAAAQPEVIGPDSAQTLRRHRGFWRNRFVLTALGVFAAFLAFGFASALDVIDLASL